MTTMTAQQRRGEAREAYNALMADCPSRQILDTLSDKWVCLVMSTLATGSHRYSELRSAIAGVSKKMLTQTLRTLEREGLVSRTVTPAVPVRVDYALTPLGTTLVPVIRAVKDWAEQHIETVVSARAAYDAKVTAGS